MDQNKFEQLTLNLWVEDDTGILNQGNTIQPITDPADDTLIINYGIIQVYPPTATSIETADYIMLFMIDDPLNSDFMLSLTSEMGNQQWIIRAIIIGSSTLIFILIGLLITHFTKKITDPITQLTTFTQKLKGADDFSAKKELIKEIRGEELFEKFSKQAKVKTSTESQVVDTEETKENLLGDDNVKNAED